MESKLTFPSFQKFSELMGISMLPKNAKQYRIQLKLSIEEAQFLYDRTGCDKLEQYIFTFGLDSMDFALMVNKVFVNQTKAQEFVDALKDLWIESNVLRKSAVFVRQSFSDGISKAKLSENNEGARVARGMIPIDIM